MPLSAQDKILAERIERDFTYHPPVAGQADIYGRIRREAKELALTLVELVPDGRERATAITKLEEAVTWANAGIARQATE